MPDIPDWMKEPKVVCTTAGELRAQLAPLADDTPLLILYDGQCGVSTKINLLPQEYDDDGDGCDWALPNTRYLDISDG